MSASLLIAALRERLEVEARENATFDEAVAELERGESHPLHENDGYKCPLCGWLGGAHDLFIEHSAEALAVHAGKSSVTMASAQIKGIDHDDMERTLTRYEAAIQSAQSEGGEEYEAELESARAELLVLLRSKIYSTQPVKPIPGAGEAGTDAGSLAAPAIAVPAELEAIDALLTAVERFCGGGDLEVLHNAAIKALAKMMSLAKG